MTVLTSGDGNQPAGPKYLRIHQDLEAKILDGAWPAGAPLPSQRQLSEEYGVTLTTMRQALQLLEDQGLIEQRHGKGTFVLPAPYSYEVGHLRSFRHDMQAQGAEPGITLLNASVVRSRRAVAARLGLPPQRGVFELRRLRSINDQPVVLQSSFLPPAIGRRLPKDQLASQSLYAVLHTHLGIRVVHATESIRPVVLTDEEAELLHRQPGEAALRSHHISFIENDQPLIDDVAIIPGDTVTIMADRRPQAVTFRYSFAGAPHPSDE